VAGRAGGGAEMAPGHVRRMEVLHALLIIAFNGGLVCAEFVFRELAPLLMLVIAVVFARYEIRDHTETARGIEHDEVLA